MKSPKRQKVGGHSYILRDRAGTHIATHDRIDYADGKETWWRSPDGSSGLHGLKTRNLPLYGIHDADVNAKFILVTEGEKCADAARARAINAVGTVTGGGAITNVACPSPDALRPLLDWPKVILWPDNDEIGRAHMAELGRSLRELGHPDVRCVQWEAAPPKGDIADFTGDAAALAAILDAAQPITGKAAVLPATRPIVSATDLMGMQFPDISWVVRDLLTAGVALMVAPPKFGKSWLCIHLGIAIASGGRALGSIPVDPGEVLYLALEDHQRRLQQRMRIALEGADVPAGLYFATEWPRLDAGGLEALDDWLEEHPRARLIVIDVLAMLRPSRARDDRYGADYADVASLREIAARRGVAMVVVHHTRKAVAEDELDRISGTNGLAAAADEILVLRRERGQHDAVLFVTGRDVEEKEHALRFHPEGGAWELLGDASDYRLSPERAAIVRALRDATKPLGPKAVAGVLGADYENTRRLMSRMAGEGQLNSRGRGLYEVPEADPNDPHDPNHVLNGIDGIDGIEICGWCYQTAADGGFDRAGEPWCATCRDSEQAAQSSKEDARSLHSAGESPGLATAAAENAVAL